MDVVDNGKPIWEARMDLESVIDSLQYYGGMGKEYNLHTGPLGHSFTTELFDHLFMSVSSLEVTTRVHLMFYKGHSKLLARHCRLHLLSKMSLKYCLGIVTFPYRLSLINHTKCTLLALAEWQL